ncbi:MAG TPA: hypothetical protein VMF69_27880 [Gemmataceae bacterium]|nr:hypothetical protein [Gemmataceae bacterium]
MDCPDCRAANVSEAASCAACGRALPVNATSGNGDRSARRSGSRRRSSDPGESVSLDSNNPAAWRAYRVALWSIVPGFGLLLGLPAIMLGCRAVRGAGDDFSGRNRAKAAVFFGAATTLTQWLGVALIYYGWEAW